MVNQRELMIMQRAASAEAAARNLEVRFEFVDGELQPVFPEELLKELFGLFELRGRKQKAAFKKLDNATVLILSEFTNY